MKDPWPIEAIDEASFASATKGVEAIADFNEFAEQWSYAFNFMFKLKK